MKAKNEKHLTRTRAREREETNKSGEEKEESPLFFPRVGHRVFHLLDETFFARIRRTTVGWDLTRKKKPNKHRPIGVLPKTMVGHGARKHCSQKRFPYTKIPLRQLDRLVEGILQKRGMLAVSANGSTHFARRFAVEGNQLKMSACLRGGRTAWR